MRLFFGCCIAGFVLLLCGKANSQNKNSGIQGQLFLQNNTVAVGASIVLIKLSDSSVVAGSAVAMDGNFKFTGILPGEYVLRITHIGYLKYVSAPVKLGSGIISLPAITLMASPGILKEVIITNKKDYIETRSDKTILNVEKSITASGSNVLEILNTAPGVKVNSSGDILFKGGQKASIAINGRIVNLSPQDIAAQLQNMQTSGVGQIELIANPSAKYDAAGAGGLINIILKKGTSQGVNGSIEQTVGYGNRSKLQSGINLNYRTKSFNFFGNYSFGNNNTDHAIITSRNVGANTNFNVNYFNSQNSYSNTYNGGVDYNIDASHTLGVLIIGYFNNYFLDKNTVSAIANRGVLDSTLTTTSVLNRRTNNINYNLNYNGKLGNSDQSLSADADYSIYNRNSRENLMSDQLNVRTGIYSPRQYFNNYAPTRIVSGSARVDYVNSLTTTSKLEAGLKFIATKSDNSQQFDNVVGTVHTANAAISSQFNYNESISSAYANYMGTPSAKFDYELSLRTEHTESTANTVSTMYKDKRSYTDLFPRVALNYHINTDNLLSLIYNRRVDRPTYQDLNPIIAYQDKYNFTSGNAYLRPSYTDRIELNHTYLDKFITSLYTSLIKDAYTFTYFSQNDATGSFTSGKLNLKQVRTVGLDITAPFAITKCWNLTVNLEGSYLHFEDYAGYLNKGATDATIKLSQQFTLPAGISINLYGQYEIPTFYTIYSYQSYYFVNSGIRKSLFNKAGTLNFTVSDVFDTIRDRYSSNYANLNLDGFDKRETRIFRLSFAYKFGKAIKNRKHVNGNSDDLNRLGPGSN